ncbi:acyltransferase family protein [Puniceibacterium sp. IMCC21224]|uniref:acyltransferase family protein n=1 Tax=Puniceibacterium sp. IMCC21224 TaxID=1618204 RepID=UPI00064DA032|nr:acyltransferase family protein [Puniceibacterium sp. IMCC21224]KMK65655.1 putative acyltransferase [Puniceibacterium sp. IMCC21224]
MTLRAPSLPPESHPAAAQSHTSLPYRPEIDGLRAIAVLSVVLYHFGVPVLGGGFVGVDIFFVISGFLIGGILWREQDETGKLNLRRFYVRRFRRLAPAFFAMALVTTLLGWALLLPFEFREYGKTLIAAVVYLSNVFFYRGAGYFDGASEEKPLLHTWSLSVEEQFYLFLPLVLLLLARWPTLRLPALITVFAASLLACVLMTPSAPEATFYLFPFRAWEMGAGVLLAIWGYESDRDWTGHPALAWLGLALVIVSIVAIRPGAGFPGVQAVPPVLGTVLLLANGRGNSTVNRVLRSRLPVTIGLISYSLYLWHWPVLVLAIYLRGDVVQGSEAAIWLALAVGLAWASWRWIEQPVRRAAAFPDLRVLGAVACGSVVLLAIGAGIYKGEGLPGRFGPLARVQIAATQDFLQDWSRCTIPDTGPLMGLEVCPIGPEGPPQVLVWGDSHVRAFKEGLDLAAHEAGTPAIILWRAGCPPLFGLRKVEATATLAQDSACTLANLQIKQSFGRMPETRRILLIGRWTYYASGTGIGRDADNNIAMYPSEGPVDTGKPQNILMAKSVRRTIDVLSQHFDRISVLRQVPEIPEYDSRAAAREAALASWPLTRTAQTQDHVSEATLSDRIDPAEAPFRALEVQGKIDVIDPWPELCQDGTCTAVHDGVGYYFDNNHVTNSAALALRDLFAPVFTPGAP